MARKVAAIWLSLVVVLSFIVIVDIVNDFIPNAKGITYYVNETGSGGAFTSIQDAIDSADNGDTVFVYSGTYYENVVINKILSLIGEHGNTTFIDGQNFGCGVNVSANWVNITGFNIFRSHTVPQWAGGIEFYNVHDCCICENNITNYEYGILLVDSSGFSITENIVSNNDAFGIYLINTSETVISNNNLFLNNYDGIRLYASSNNNTITENRLRSKGIGIWSCSDNTVTNNNGSVIFLTWGSSRNYVLNNTSESISLHDGSTLNLIEGNEVSNCDSYGMGLINSANNNNVTLNNIYNNEGGLYISSSSNNYVFQNNIINNDYGIKNFGSYNEFTFNNIISNSNVSFSLSGHGHRISDNNISDNGDGIIFGHVSNGNLIAQNVISNNTAGIMLDGDLIYFNDIISNKISDNQKGIYINNTSQTSPLKDSIGHEFYHNEIFNNNIGIYLEVDNDGIIDDIIINSSSIYENDIGIRFDGALGIINGSLISNCVIENNRIGIYMDQSKNCQIINNSVRNNGEYGIYLTQSEHNLIYQNNFVNNNEPTQVYDDMDSNFWNGTYPTGGNYWSDYEGIDRMCGPNQDETGSDGMGDNPYPVYGDSNQDIYPLMSPYFPDTKVPFGPRGIEAITGDGYVNLTWGIPYYDGGSPITSYNIYRDNLDTHISVSANQAWYKDSNVINGITYTYFVSAENSIGESPNTTINATPMTTPQIPQNLQVLIEDGFVNLTWNAPLDDGGSPITNYTIYRSTTAGHAGMEIAKIGNVLFYNDTDVVSNVTYYYKVRAVNIVGNGPFTNETVANLSALPSTSESPSEKEFPWFWMILSIIIIVIMTITILAFIIYKKRK